MLSVRRQNSEDRIQNSEVRSQDVEYKIVEYRKI